MQHHGALVVFGGLNPHCDGKRMRTIVRPHLADAATAIVDLRARKGDPIKVQVTP